MMLEQKIEDLMSQYTKIPLPQKKQEKLNFTDSDFCGKCDNGWYWEKDQNECSIARECPCRKKALMSRRLKFGNLPKAFCEIELESFQTDIYRKEDSRKKINLACGIIQVYLEEFEVAKQIGKGLYLYSNTRGSGKTRMVASIANRLMKKYNAHLKFATSLEILNEIRATWGKKESGEYSESQLMNALCTVEVLVIDDFATEIVRDWSNEKFNSMIDQRYYNKLITIYTSNYALKDLPYDNRIKSRITERSYEIAFPEEDIRLYVAEKDRQSMLKHLKNRGVKHGK